MRDASLSIEYRRVAWPLALAFAFGWMLDVSLFIPEGMLAALSFLPYPHLILTALAFAVLAAGNDRCETWLRIPWHFIECTMACILAIIIPCTCGIAQIALPEIVYAIFALVVSLYQAMAIISCLKRLSRLSMIDCMLTLAAWQLFVAILRAVSVIISSWLVTGLAPFVIYLCLARPDAVHAACEEPGSQEPSGAKEETASWFPVRLLAINVLVILTIQALQSMSGNPVANLSYIGTLIAIVIIGVILVVSKKFIRMQQLYRISLAGLECALVIFALGTADAQWVSSVLLDATYALFSVFFITTLCNACQRNNRESVRIFAITYLLEQIAALLGSTASQIATGRMEVFALTLLAGLGAVAFVWLASDDDYLTAWSTSHRKPNYIEPSVYYNSVSEICSSVAMQYSLSPRESDVLLLLAQRKTAAQISEELVVSNATAKTHTHNIYKKLDVHSKQELFDFLGLPNVADEQRNG
ncbi:MAG: helix-turn-helix transcriptional regulator [Eggerthellaceae bacterium]|nr:helix-turn-helix transcriptional regulator [Eggerthellaceae bacterium]MBR3257542.1 helix-turn-helix transcriptional regulator [Eggerthellaceae bacterium]